MSNPTPNKLELVSFKLCPYVQRAVIALRAKEVPYEITYIDLNDPPAWFEEISPLGKVPLLKVNETHVLFESAVIAEYIDEVTPGSLHPADPLEKAENRAWIEFASACLMDVFNLGGCDSDEGYQQTLQSLLHKLDRLEQRLGDGPFFNGSAFSLVDAAFAPLCMRLEILQSVLELLPCERLPKLCAWSQALNQQPAVQESVVPEFAELFLMMQRKRGGHLASLLG
jgi:glutathione S-transferase